LLISLLHQPRLQREDVYELQLRGREARPAGRRRPRGSPRDPRDGRRDHGRRPPRRGRTDVPLHPPSEGGVRAGVPHPPVHDVDGPGQDPRVGRRGPGRDPLPRPSGPLVPGRGERLRPPVSLRILERRWKTTVHYCTSGYKDGWQLRSRIKRRAENVARPWDVVTEDGTLVKGILEGSDLERLMRDLEVRHRVPKDLMGLDDARKRLEVAPWILQEIAPILGRPAFLVEEYPTADGLEVERTRLA